MNGADRAVLHLPGGPVETTRGSVLAALLAVTRPDFRRSGLRPGTHFAYNGGVGNNADPHPPEASPMKHTNVTPESLVVVPDGDTAEVYVPDGKWENGDTILLYVGHLDGDTFYPSSVGRGRSVALGGGEAESRRRIADLLNVIGVVR